MAVFNSKEAHLVVLSDLDEARAAIQAALTDAGSSREAGLRQALSILEGFADADPRLRWVGRVLTEKGIDPRQHEVAAIKALRSALPGLSLVAATELAVEYKGTLAA
ncbi:hypothetical protein [Streptomyces alfalfae]